MARGFVGAFFSVTCKQLLGVSHEERERGGAKRKVFCFNSWLSSEEERENYILFEFRESKMGLYFVFKFLVEFQSM